MREATFCGCCDTSLSASLTTPVPSSCCRLGVGHSARRDGRLMVERFWGEMGYVRVAFSALYVVSVCVWATVQSFTAAELNYQVHCHEGGDCCGGPGPSPSSSPPLPTTYFFLDSGTVRGVTVVGQSPRIEGVKACVTSWPLR